MASTRWLWVSLGGRIEKGNGWASGLIVLNPARKKASVRAAARDKSPLAEHFLVGVGGVLDCDNLKMAFLTALQCIVCHLLRHC